MEEKIQEWEVLLNKNNVDDVVEDEMGLNSSKIYKNLFKNRNVFNKFYKVCLMLSRKQITWA